MIYYRKCYDGHRHIALTVNNTPRFLLFVYYFVLIVTIGCCGSNFNCNAFAFTSWLQKPSVPTSLMVSSSHKSMYTTSCETYHKYDTRNTVVSFKSRSASIPPRGYKSYRNAVVRDDDMTEELNDHHHSGSNKKVVFADYMATCVPGMAHILADELRMLGGQDIELSGTSAVYFRVDYHQPTIILTILLWCRTAHKIMELLCRTTEPVYTRNDVYEWIRNTIPTKDLLLNPNAKVNGEQSWFTLSVAVTLNNAKYIPSDINHSHYTALNIKNALVDAAREVSENDAATHHKFESDRPSVDITESCDVPLMVMVRGIPSATPFTAPYSNNNYYNHNNNNYNERSRNDPRTNQFSNDRVDTPPSSGGAHISLFRCIHGIGSLHRRGYRTNMQIHKAAMKESTAAALLYAAQWHIKCQQKNGAVLMDPMMGSGTLLVEGAMMATDIAPGLMRIKCGIPSSQSPPMLRWKIDTDDDNDNAIQTIQTIWNRLLMDATKRAQRGIESLQERNIQIIGNDINDRAYELADASFQQAGLRKVVQLDCTDCAHWKPKLVTAASRDNSDSMIESNAVPWMIVSNPPWGVRLSEDMEISWEALRTFLRSDSSIVPKSSDDTNQSEVWILSGNAEATKHLGLRRSQSIPLQTGDQNLRWLQYVLRPPGTMNTTSTSKAYSGDGYKTKFEPVNAPQPSKHQGYNQVDDTNVDRVPFEREGRNRNFESQFQTNYRSTTTNQFSDRNVRFNDSNRKTGRGQRQDSYSSPRTLEQWGQRRPSEQPRKPRKVKTAAAPPKDSENEWLI